MSGMRHSATKTLLILSAAVFLRGLAPAGYMPSSGNGLLFELCPEGIPAEFMAMLSGNVSQDHGHHHGGHHGSHHDAVGGHDCSMGHLLLAAAAVDNAVDTAIAPAVSNFAIVPRYSFTSAARTQYDSRGPPA